MVTSGEKEGREGTEVGDEKYKLVCMKWLAYMLYSTGKYSHYSVDFKCSVNYKLLSLYVVHLKLIPYYKLTIQF